MMFFKKQHQGALRAATGHWTEVFFSHYNWAFFLV